MKVSILAPDLSENAVSRAYLLARAAQRHHEVEIVGPVLGSDVWEPLRQASDVAIRQVACSHLGKTPGAVPALMHRLADAADGDVLYASKPLVTNLGAALIARGRRRRPVLVDIDDWQVGMRRELLRDLPLWRLARATLVAPFRSHRSTSWWNTVAGERLIRFADAVSVTTVFLRERFGGSLLGHGQDTTVFDPARFDRAAIRRKLGIEDRRVIMFCGSLRPYKGWTDLVAAVGAIDDPDLLLALVGETASAYSRSAVREAEAALGTRFVAYGAQPYTRVPEYLAAADLVCIPQRSNEATAGQLPIKLFDAMAMGKPIIATAVSDLPEALVGSGWVVPPQDPARLAAAIEHAFRNPVEAERLGRRARARTVEEFSVRVMGDRLARLIDRALARQRPRVSSASPRSA